MDKKRFLKKTGYLIGTFLLLFPVLAFAFETKFPAIPGVPSPTNLLSFINYLYYFLLVVGSMVSSLSLIYGGVIYFFSSNNPGKTFFARQQIFSSFTGLGILLLSFVILNFLNPNLTIIKLPNTPTISGPGLSPIISPEKHIISYWELPMGEVEDDVLNKTNALVQPVDLAGKVEEAVKELEEESKKLEILLKSCKCSNLNPDCDNECAQLECKNLFDETADQRDLCPNLDEIEDQQDKIKAAQAKLKLARESLLFAKINLEITLIKLSVTRSLLKSCLSSPMDLNTFLGIQDMEGIEKKKFFNDTSAKSHPLTFYCDLDEEFVSEMLEFWESALAEMLTRLEPADKYCSLIGTCSDGVGYCSFENMKRYFINDETSHMFSAICQRESSGNPLALNDGCLTGSSLDYSVGLMQINLLAYCTEAISYNLATKKCTVLNQAKLNQCVQKYQNVDNNLKKAVAIFALQGYGAWGAAYACGFVDGCENPPAPPPVVENNYIGVTKIPNPRGPFQNNQLPFSVQYTTTVTAKQQKLTNIQFQYNCKVTKGGSSISCPSLSTSIPTPPAEISPGNPFTFSYRQTYTTGFQNSLVTDTITVTAIPSGASSQTSTASVNIIVGNPPTGCFALNESWSANSDYKTKLESAIAYLVSSYPAYATKICSGGNLELRYNSAGNGNLWGMYHGSYVDFFPKGITNVRYILFHEACHALMDRIPAIFAQYLDYPGILNETLPYCFYAYGSDKEERLCEAISFYANDPCGNFRSRNPIHYQFVKDFVY